MNKCIQCGGPIPEEREDTCCGESCREVVDAVMELEARFQRKEGR